MEAAGLFFFYQMQMAIFTLKGCCTNSTEGSGIALVPIKAYLQSSRGPLYHFAFVSYLDEDYSVFCIYRHSSSYHSQTFDYFIFLFFVFSGG